MSYAQAPPGRLPDSRGIDRLGRHPAASVAVLATLLALVLTYPLAIHLTTAIYGGPGDSTGTIGTFWWWGFALHHGRSVLNNTLLGAPFGAGWAGVPFAVLPLAIFAPLSAVIGPTAAYNVGMLSSFPLTALATYLLARRLEISPVGATFSALAFTFIPYHAEKAMGHLLQTHLEIFPAFLIFAVRWWQGGSRWNLAAAGAVLGLSVWLDYYFAFILAAEVAAFFAVSLLLPGPTRKQLRLHLLQNVIGMAVVGATAALFVPAALLLAHRPGTGAPYGQSVASAVGIYHRSLGDIQIYSARWFEYLQPWHSNPLLPAALRASEVRNLHSSNFTEQSLFIGYTVILLAVVGLFLGRRLFIVVLGLGVAAVGFALSMPPDLHPLGLVHFHAPSHYLNNLVPFFRVYSRFGLLVPFGVSLLAGLGLTAVEVRMSRPRLRWLMAIPFLLLGVEFNNLPPSHTTQLFPAPAEYRWLHDQQPGILIEYPLEAGNPQRQEIETRQYVFYQQVHEHPIFNGATGKSRAELLQPSLEPYSSPEVVDRLRALGIRYVFVHRSDYVADAMALPSSVEGLRLVTTLDGTDVYVVTGSGTG